MADKAENKPDGTTTSHEQEEPEQRMSTGDESEEQRTSDIQRLDAVALQDVLSLPSSLSKVTSATSVPRQSVSVEQVHISGDHSASFFGPLVGCTFIVKSQDHEQTPHQPSYRGASQESTTRATLHTPEAESSQHLSGISPRLQRKVELAAADSCAATLRTTYKTTGSSVQMIPWVDDDSKDIKDVYTRLMLEIEDGLTKSERKNKTLKSYGKMFQLETKDGDPIQIAILNGMAGRGKSTLVNKMANDWALYVGVLQRYKLVFVLKMHALDQSSDIIDSVFDQLMPEDTDVDQGALDMFITNNPDKVLFLMDGFDELMTTSLSETSFGSVLRILNRKKYRGCSVVVTTRPSHYANLVTKSLVQKPFAHIKVSGFSAEDIDGYVSKFYSEEHDKAEGFLERIKSSDVLLDLAKSPMLLLLMCLLWRSDSALPETLSRLYNEAVAYIFKRKGVSPVEISKILNEIGKIALRGLLAPDQILAFKESDFDANVLDIAMKAGVLTKQRVLKGLATHNSVQFIHKTFQEFYAADYVQILLKEDTVEFQKTLDKIVSEDPVKFESLLRFCSGDNPACCDTILQSLQKLKFDGRLKKLAVNCYFESQQNQLPSIESIQSIITDEMVLMVWDSDSLNSLSYFLKHVADQAEDKENANLATVQKLELLNCKSQRFWSVLAYSMSKMANITTLKLIDCSLTGDNLTCLVSSLRGSANLTELNISYNEPLGGSAAFWAPELQELKELQKLVLCECLLTGEDVKHICMSLCNQPNLAELDLSSNRLLGAAVKLWCPVLKQLKHLQTLNLDGCNVDESSSLKSLTGSISSLKNLVKCSVMGVEGQMSKTHLIERTKTGIKLNLHQCQPRTGTDQADILKAFSNRSDLVELSLDGEKINSLLFSDLKRMKSLRKLTLDNFKFERDFKSLIQSVGLMENLVDCSVSFTYQFGIKHLFEQTDDGIRIDLSEFTFSDTDLEGLFDALSSRHDLVELIMNGNDQLSCTADLWAHNFSRLKQLQKLDFRNCSLTRTGVKHVAGSLRCLPHLVEMNISGSGSSTELWRPHLNQLNHLTTLRLGNRNYEGDVLYRLSNRNLGVKEVHQLPTVLESVKSGTNVTRLKEQSGTGTRLDLSEALTDIDLAGALKAIRNKSDLLEIILKGNHALVGSAESWTDYLKQFDQLRFLDLSCCSLTGDDLRDVIEAVCFLPNLLELKLSGNKLLRGTSAMWFHRLKRLRHLQTIRLDDCDFEERELNIVSFCCFGDPADRSLNIVSDADVSFMALTRSGLRLDMSKSLAGINLKYAHVVKLVLSGNHALGGKAKLWAHNLKYLRYLKKLDLSSCSLIGEDVARVVEFLCDLGDLVELNLSGNELTSGPVTMWCQKLQHLTHLKTLTLDGCNFSSQDFRCLVESLSCMGCLANCSVGSNWEINRVNLFEETHTGLRVNLSKCSFTCAELAGALEALGNRSDLVELILGRPPPTVEALWSHMEYMEQLLALDFSSCSKGVEDEAEIKVSLWNLSGLFGACISFDEHLVGSALWSPHLKLLKHLQGFDWSVSSVTVQDCVSVTLPPLIDLVECYISFNEPLGGSAALWCPPLKRLKHLQMLDLSYCSLTGEDMIHILGSGGMPPDLVELDLSFNPKLGQSVASWSPYRRGTKRPTLQRLTLEGCGISEEKFHSTLRSSSCTIQ